MSTNATIKLDLDTTGAKGSLDALDRRISQSARAAQSGMGGGGLLGQILGMGAGGLSMTALAGMAAAPLARDAGTVAQGIFGTAGEMASGALGLRGWAGDVSAAKKAQDQTIQALGPAASSMSDTQIREVFDAFKRMADLMQGGENRVKGATDVEVAAAAFKPLLDKFDELIKAITQGGAGARMSTGGSGAMPGAGR